MNKKVQAALGHYASYRFGASAKRLTNATASRTLEIVFGQLQRGLEGIGADAMAPLILAMRAGSGDRDRPQCHS